MACSALHWLERARSVTCDRCIETIVRLPARPALAPTLVLTFSTLSSRTKPSVELALTRNPFARRVWDRAASTALDAGSSPPFRIETVCPKADGMDRAKKTMTASQDMAPFRG